MKIVKLINNTHKECSGCKQILPLDTFCKDKRKPFGLASKCKICKHNYYMSKHDLFISNRKKYRDNNIEKIKKQKRETYIRNHTKIRQQAREWYAKNRESTTKKNAEWRKTSLKGRYMNCRIAAVKRNKEFNITIEQFNIETLKPCTYCGTISDRRGLDRVDNNLGYIPTNVTSCCWRCNWMKMDSTVDDFIDKCKKIVEYISLQNKNSSTLNNADE